MSDYDETFEAERVATKEPGRGLVTQPTRVTPPALVAEQHRAIAEIQAALTVAKSFPRDEAHALECILNACDRPGVAEEAEYEYSKGGTAIIGPTIRLLEVVAQQWGNIEFGFRELTRHYGNGAEAGESIAEAFAWDLQTNTRRKVVFSVKHEIEKKDRSKKRITDPRDIYELVANNAQRRVRTCLENVIPRDIVDAGVMRTRETMRVKEEVTPEKIAKLLTAFGGYGVTKMMIELKLQRKIETMSPAQMVRLRRVYTSLKDGMGGVEDYFDAAAAAPEAPKNAADAAKEKIRAAKAAADAAKQQQTDDLASGETVDSAGEVHTAEPVQTSGDPSASDGAWLNFQTGFPDVQTLEQLDAMANFYLGDKSPLAAGHKQTAGDMINRKRAELTPKPKGKPKQGQQNLMDTSHQVGD